MGNGGFRLPKNPFGLFRQIFAACHIHNFSAYGGQIPHLQSDMYFVQVHAPAKNDFYLIRRSDGEILAAVSGFTALRLLYALWVLCCYFDPLKPPLPYGKRRF